MDENETTVGIGKREEIRLQVLRALETDPDQSQRQLAKELGVSLGGLNYALKALIERGCVKVEKFRKSGTKVAYLYVLTANGVAEKAFLATAFLGRKLEEYEMLKQEIEALKSEVGSDHLGDSQTGARS